MKTRATLRALPLLALAFVGAAGCADNASVQVQAICSPTDDCTFSGTCDTQYIGYPTLDIGTSASDVLWLVLQVGNQLPNNADSDTWRVNTNDAHVDETVVEYQGALGGSKSVGSNFLVPAGGSAVVSVKLDMTGAVVGPVLATLRMRGYFDDGTRFETGEFPISITVCSGCVPACLTATCPPSSSGQAPLVCIP